MKFNFVTVLLKAHYREVNLFLRAGWIQSITFSPLVFPFSIKKALIVAWKTECFLSPDYHYKICIHIKVYIIKTGGWIKCENYRL